MSNPIIVEPQRPVADRRDEPTAAIRAEGLTKSYRHPWTGRTVRGLERLDLTVPRGEVIGLLGPNGAGKTTTLKLLTGLLRPTSGQAWLFGVPIDDTASRRPLGFLPEQPYFYDYLNGVEYLELAGQLSGLARHDATRSARHWLGRVGLGERPKLKLRKYSKGMLQRLGLAAALVHEPELLILDEPMSGLDPFGRRDVRELIHEQRERGTTVLFSSHILPDVEMLCDRVAIVLKGRLTRVATLSELTEGHGHPVQIRCAGRPVLALSPEWQGAIERLERGGETSFMLADGSRLDAALAMLLAAGVHVHAVTPQRMALEDLLLDEAERSGFTNETRRTA